MAALGALAANKTLNAAGYPCFVPSGIQQDFLVKTSTVIYVGALVAADANGLLVPAADASATYFLGVALSQVTGDGTLKCAVDIGGGILDVNYTPASAVITMAGNSLFADGDQDCDIKGGVSNYNMIGVALSAPSTTELRVKLLDAGTASLALALIA